MKIVIGILIVFIIFTGILFSFLWDKMKQLEEMDRRICARLDSMLNCEVTNHNAVMQALIPDNREMNYRLDDILDRQIKIDVRLESMFKGRLGQ